MEVTLLVFTDYAAPIFRFPTACPSGLFPAKKVFLHNVLHCPATTGFYCDLSFILRAITGDMTKLSWMDKKNPPKVRNARVTGLGTLSGSSSNACVCLFWREAFRSGEQTTTLSLPAKQMCKVTSRDVTCKPAECLSVWVLVSPCHAQLSG